MTTNIATVFPNPVPAGATCIYKAILSDPSNPGQPISIASLTLTLCDARLRNVINNVQNANINNTGRGALAPNPDGSVTLTLTLGAAANAGDTAKVSNYDNELRAAIIEWTYGPLGSLQGKHEFQFPITSLAPAA
jgi:hypothetical protein